MPDLAEVKISEIMRKICFPKQTPPYTALPVFVTKPAMTEVSYNCRDLLKRELDVRKEKNEAYSLRSFALALELSPGYLSLVLSGRRHLSSNKAKAITRKLSWASNRKKYFVTLAEYESSKSEHEKKHLLGELKKFGSNEEETALMQLDQFNLIAQWQHSAILVLLDLPQLKKTTDVIAKRLNITDDETQTSLERMQRLDMVAQTEDGEWQPTRRNTFVEGTPSKAIRQYHKDYLNKATTAIETQNFNDREFSTFVVTVDPKMLPEAKIKIKEFQQEMLQLLEGESPSRVYQMAIQLARVDQD